MLYSSGLETSGETATRLHFVFLTENDGILGDGNPLVKQPHIHLIQWVFVGARIPLLKGTGPGGKTHGFFGSPGGRSDVSDVEQIHHAELATPTELRVV